MATEGMFDLLRNLRVDTTEVCLNTFSEYEKDYIDALAAQRGSIDVVAVSPYSIQFEPQLFSPNMRVRNDAEVTFKKVCYACFALGAKYYTFRGPMDFARSKGIDEPRLAQRYNQLADIASAYGVTLSIKNMRWNLATTPVYYKQILELCPRICATLDLFNAESAGYELKEFMDICPPDRISLIEVADVAKGEWGLPGKGKYNFERLFNELEKRKIVAPVLIEVRSNSYTDFPEVKESVEYLKSVYNSVKS